MSDSESDDQDWFHKDENDIVLNFTTKTNQDETEKTVEYIKAPIATDRCLQMKRLEASVECSVAAKAKRLSTQTLRNAVNLDDLELFLFAKTSEPNFFVGQISANDSLQRVISYIRIWSRLCDLEIYSFQRELLENLKQNETFFEQLLVVASKLFQRMYKNIWKNEEEIDQILYAMKSLIFRLDKAQLITTQISNIINRIKKLIQETDDKDILAKVSCQHFKDGLNRILTDKELLLTSKMEIYPSLDELVTEDIMTDNENNLMQNVGSDDCTKYIEIQKQKLRGDFIIPLWEYVRQIKNSTSRLTLENLYEDVFIVFNTDLSNAKRHEMILIDILGSKRSMPDKNKKLSRIMQNKLTTIKTGSLLVLSKSKAFENLILATVTGTDKKLLCQGYIGIEIVRQYNIGTVNDQSFLMFESPAFFEPYNHVYSYLNTYGDDELPMKRYIIDGEKNVSKPSYLKSDVYYTYNGDKFEVNASKPRMPRNLPLNESQWNSYMEALRKEFYLIQGPPGSGKTHLTVHLVRTLIENAKTPIILITYKNDSLDNLLLKLSAYTNNILRIGSQSRLPEISKFNINFEPTHAEMVDPNLKRLYYVTNEEFKLKFQIVQQMHANFDGSEESYQLLRNAQKNVTDITEKLKSIRLMFQFYEARKAGVIAMTSTCAAKSNFLFRLLKSKIVIFEEAPEIMEPHVLACLTPYTEHVIMIGDHMQLKPYTSCYRQSRSCHLNVSLFERLFVNNCKGSTLHIQYRMRPCIADLLQPIFYTHIINDENVQKYPKVRCMLKDLYFYTHNEFETQSEDDSSFYNDFEIKEVLNLAKYLIDKGKYTVKDIAILSPYAKQIEHFKIKSTGCQTISKLKIATVDSFQGLEANIVLLSLVRSNSKKQIGFLQEKNRICVALSRAKYGLYIIGNMSLLSKCNETWRAIEEKLQEKDSIGDKFPRKKKEK